MLERITSEHDMSSLFWSLPSCFYNRNLDSEEAFCYPYTQNIDESRIGEHTPPIHSIRLVSNISFRGCLHHTLSRV